MKLGLDWTCRMLGAAAALACLSVGTQAQGTAPTPTQQVTVVVILEEAMGDAFVTWAILSEVSSDAQLAGDKFPLRRPVLGGIGHAQQAPKLPGLPAPGVLPEPMQNPGQTGQPGSKIPLRKPVKHSGYVSTRSL